MGLLSFLYRKFGEKHYSAIKFSQLCYYWFLQRIIGFNSELPFIVNPSNKISGFKNINKIGFSVKESLLVSNGIYIAVFENSTLNIGEGTIIAFNVCIQTANHNLNDLSKFTVANVIIGKNCWLANGSIVLPGVTLGDNVIVAANAVVTKSFPSDVVIGGIPAKIIKYLK